MASERWLTVGDVAAELSVDAGKVLAWIHSHQLKASDITETRGERPRWRIRREDLDAFLKARQLPQPPAAAPPRRRRAAAGVREFV